MRRRRRAACTTAGVALVVAVAATGCGGDTPADPDGAASAAPSDAPSSAPSVALPPTAVASELDWLVGAINAGDVSVAELEERMAPSLLAQVPAPMLRDLVLQLGSGGSVTITEYDGDAVRATAVLATSPDGDRMRVDLAVRSDPPHRIEGLFLSPVDAEGDVGHEDVPTDVAGVEELIAGLAPDTSLLLADGGCTPTHASRADEPRAIASAAKLYVAIAVLEAVHAGELDWQGAVPIRPSLTSLPPGETRYEEPGTEATVETLLARAMTTSDNTATDHLIHLVGRGAVEAAMTAADHHDPSRNRPFPTTREMALLKLTGDEGRVSAFIEADEDGRRALLGQLDGIPIGDLRDLDVGKDPVLVEEIEWFATAEDLCRAWVVLHDLAAALPGAREALGTLTPPGDASYLAFKDGYEPGVGALSWYVEHPDDEVVVAIVLLNDAEADLPPASSRRVIDALLPLLTDAGGPEEGRDPP